MKRKLTALAGYMCVVACVLLAFGCSTKTPSDLTSLIGDDAKMAVFFSLDAIEESLEVKDGELPADIQDFSEDFSNVIEKVLSIDGYDSDWILAVGYSGSNSNVCVSSILDEGALKNSLEEAGFKSVEGAYVHSDADVSVVMRDNLCWFVGSSEKATEIVNRLIKKAEQKPAAQWKLDQLNNIDDATFYGFFESLGKYAFFGADFVKSALDGYIVMLDEDGSIVADSSENVKTDISALSKYVDRNATVGLIFADNILFPDLTSVLASSGYSELAELTTTRLAANLQINQPRSDQYTNPDYCSVQVALEATPGNAPKLLAAICSIFEGETGLMSTGSATHREIGFGIWKVILDVEDDFVVARYGANEINTPFAANDVDGQLIRVVGNVPAHTAILGDNQFDYVFDLKVDAEQISFHLEFKDTEMLFLHALLYNNFRTLPQLF